jgi:uncharacterized glyoxalase superfamily protein PhnB
MATFKKLTPVLVVDRIEPCLPFWQRLGFEKTVEVPHENALGFALLVKDGIEVMYQSVASAKHDVPAMNKSVAALYVEVDALDSLLALLEGVEIVVPRRKAFYGADEVFVREPGGNIVGFSQPAP